jgi:hypothetical protein
MATLESRSKIAAAPEQRVGSKPERRSEAEGTSLAQTIIKTDEGVQTAQLQSLFDTKDEDTK